MRRSPRNEPGIRAGWRIRTLRAFLWGGLAAGLLLLMHIGVTRWLLSGNRLRSWINTNPETTLLDYDEALSLWPGRVRIRNLRIRSSDANVQWILHLTEARVRYSVTSLLHRTFRADRVEGSQLTFRLRQKLDPSDPGNPPVSLLPSISGYSDPPLRRPEPEGPADEGGNPWTIDIRGISIGRFEEIWFDVYRFEGHADLLGQFLLRPGQRARVGPATIDFRDGKLAIGSNPIALGWTGRLGTSIDEWDPRRVQGAAVWRNISATARLRGTCAGLEFLNHYVRRSARPRFSGGRGTLSIAGTVQRGNASGDVELVARDASARMAKVGLTGDVDVKLRITDWNLERGSLNLDSSRLRLSDVVASGEDKSRGWWGRFTLLRARIERGLSAMVETQCRDARPLLAVLGVKLPGWTRGLFELDGLTASANVVLAPTRTSVRSLEARGGKFQIRGEYERRAALQRGVFLIEYGPLDVGVLIQDGSSGVQLIGAKAWYEKKKGLESRPPLEDDAAHAGR